MKSERKPPKRQTNFLLYLIYIIASCLFFASLLILTGKLPVDTLGPISHFFPSNPSQSNSIHTIPPQSIKLINQFDFDISVYFEDGESGMFLSTIPSKGDIDIRAEVGNSLFATQVEGFDRFSRVFIREGVKKYNLGPVSEATTPKETQPPQVFVQLNAEYRTRKHPAVLPLRPNERADTAMSAKFRSLSSRRVNMWYDDGRGGVPQGHLSLGQETTTNTYEGHVFFVTDYYDRKREIARFSISKDKSLYIIQDAKYPPPKDLLDATEREERFMKEYFNRTGILWKHYYGPLGVSQTDDDKSQRDKEMETGTGTGRLRSDQGSSSKVGGPRPPPVLNMWPVTGKTGENGGEGVVHRVVSTSGHWKRPSLPTPTTTTPSSYKDETSTSNSNSIPHSIPSSLNSLSLYQSSAPLSLELECISTHPRVFVIPDFLSSEEAAQIISLASPKTHESGVGDGATGVMMSDTRTSTNAWLGREGESDRERRIRSQLRDLNHPDPDQFIREERESSSSLIHKRSSLISHSHLPTTGNSSSTSSSSLYLNVDSKGFVRPGQSQDVINSLFLRASHVLGIPEEKLTREQCAEDMQVVHYKLNQKYDAHHDWGVSGFPASRFLTLLLYLTDQPHPGAGGETSFPKAQLKDGTIGFKVRPPKGTAVLFYNLLPDGNGDDLSLHAALPVHDPSVHAEKWLANFWVWDPKFEKG